MRRLRGLVKVAKLACGLSHTQVMEGALEEEQRIINPTLTELRNEGYAVSDALGEIPYFIRHNKALMMRLSQCITIKG